MQVLNERAACGAARHEIHRAPRGIDHRGAYDPDIAAEVLVRPTTCPGHVGPCGRPHARRGKASLPVQSAVVSIVGIQRVVDRGDIDDVMVAGADGDMAHDQRLGIHLVVYGQHEHRAELLHVDVAGGQRGFVVVPAGPGVVVVLRKHSHRLGIRRAIARQVVLAGGEQ